MTRRYGRARRGQRVREATPGGHWRTLTVLGSIRASGWVATMTIEAATDGDIFWAYVDQVLCPQLRPGDVVVMDNLAAHKVDGVRQRIEETGARVRYLPPYSPDFNPIENLWSQIKVILRALAPRTADQLLAAAATAFDAISPADRRGFFLHARYAI